MEEKEEREEGGERANKTDTFSNTREYDAKQNSNVRQLTRMDKTINMEVIRIKTDIEKIPLFQDTSLTFSYKCCILLLY